MGNDASALSRLGRSFPVVLISLLIVLSQAGTSSGQLSQDYQTPNNRNQPFYRIDIEDSGEAGLIEQQLKVKPVLVRSNSFYYYGRDKINQLLSRYGYEPVRVNPEDILTRVENFLCASP